MPETSVKRDGSPASAATTPQPLRRRSGGRTKLQQEQKESSRQRLLESAGRLYTELSYGTTTVDDIARDARVSRTTFYRHFDDKLAIAEALFAQAMIPIEAIHEALADHADPGEKEIALWINQLIDALQPLRTLIQTIREVETSEPQSEFGRKDRHHALIQLFGKRIPAFRAAASEAARNGEARMRARLLLLTFDQFFYYLIVRGGIDRAMGVKVMAGEMRRFIVDFAPKPANVRTKSS